MDSLIFGSFGLNGHVILLKIDTEDMFFFLQNAEDGSLPFLNFIVEQLILLFTFYNKGHVCLTQVVFAMVLCRKDLCESLYSDSSRCGETGNLSQGY